MFSCELTRATIAHDFSLRSHLSIRCRSGQKYVHLIYSASIFNWMTRASLWSWLFKVTCRKYFIELEVSRCTAAEMTAWINKNALCISILFISVVASDICDICQCFNYENSDRGIMCKNTKTKTPNIDLTSINWPAENATIRVFFNNITLNLLPKWVSNHSR
jgi:hypothetical protein